MNNFKPKLKIYVLLRSLFFSTLNSIAKIFLEIFVFDKKIRRILKGNLAKLYLKKYIKQADKIYLKQSLDKKIEQTNQKPKIIWQFWEQGFDNAPNIVKACVDSVEKHKNGCEHILLDMNNLKNYIQIPDYIYKLKEKGIIKSAHFSDIVRTYLLSDIGGTWVDSTVFFSNDLAQHIINSDLFIFQNYLKIDLDNLNMASYFISAKPHHIILEKAKILFNLYWIENNFLNNYFMFLHAFTMLSQSTKESKEELQKIPFFNFIPVQHFQKELLNQYSKERWEQIKSISSIHKLSYKDYVLSKHKKIEIEGTFLEKLIKGELD